jgi:hypothetical protein
MATTYRPGRRRAPSRPLRVQGDLLARRGKCPSDLETAFLTEDEPQLARRAQAIGMGRTKGPAGARLGYRTEQVLVKEAVLAARLA